MLCDTMRIPFVGIRRCIHSSDRSLRKVSAVKTSSCEAPHFQYHVAGVLRIRMDDGAEFDCRPGDVSLLPSGHDAWVVGDEAAVIVDFQGMLDYAVAHKHAA